MSTSAWSNARSFVTKAVGGGVEKAKLVASDGVVNDEFGYSVDISTNGDYVIIGSVNSDIATKGNQGAAYIFVRSGSTWTQQAKLVASNGVANDKFGFSVAISGNGARVIIGAPYRDLSSITNIGAIYTFDRSGTSWSQQQSGLIASDRADGDFFGCSVAISNDGSRIVVGAKDAKVGDNNGQGKAYIFNRSETSWGQIATLIASDGLIYGRFGYCVSISPNGDYVLIGSGNAKVGDNNGQGKAYIFTISTVNINIWYQRSVLTSSDGASDDRFGGSLSTNGEYNIIGAPYQNIGSNGDQGSAYIFG